MQHVIKVLGSGCASCRRTTERITKIARELEWREEEMCAVERRIHECKIHSYSVDLPPLPDFSRFHPAFLPGSKHGTPGNEPLHRLLPAVGLGAVTHEVR